MRRVAVSYRRLLSEARTGKYRRELMAENATTRPMTFGEALEIIKRGSKVQRSGWNGKGMYVFLIGNEMSKGNGWTYTNGVNDNMPLLPFIAMKTADEKVVPWLASQTDILAEDWLVA